MGRHKPGWGWSSRVRDQTGDAIPNQRALFFVFVANLISNLGSGLNSAAVAWYILDTTPSEKALATFALLQTVRVRSRTHRSRLFFRVVEVNGLVAGNAKMEYACYLQGDFLSTQS